MSVYNIAEIFGPTIQGEGPNVGCKCIFVRVVGCDFNCEWCDSKFAWKKDDNSITYNQDQLIKKLVSMCEETNTGRVILTGGNPCLYDFGDVIDALHENSIRVDVETQGSKLPDWTYKVDQLVISPKAPSSKQPDVYETIKEHLSNEELIPVIYDVAIKIPIFDDIDYEFAKKYYKLCELIRNEFDINIRMYLSVGNTDTSEQGDISKRILMDYEKLINKVCNDDMKNVYILPQVHTLIWGNKQGV